MIPRLVISLIASLAPANCGIGVAGGRLALTLGFASVIAIAIVGVGSAKMTGEEVSQHAQRAEATVARGYKAVWDWRLRLDRADGERDPYHTGMIGLELTPITTTIGYEDAKELSTHSGWAAWIVRQLAEKDVHPKDKVAVSMTGSFPALNLAVIAALQELKIDMVAISSVGSSSFGANELGFTWPEMERELYKRDVLKVRCKAVTLGGTGDRGLEWSAESIKLAVDAANASGLEVIRPRNLHDAIMKRLHLYGKPEKYACFINVGGGQPTLGGGRKIRFSRGGWFFEPPEEPADPRGVMDAFLDAGVPCLNLLYLEELNKREGIVTR